MQPLNNNERKKAFWKFVLLFLVSVILITTTIFFSITVPFKQNDQLRKEMDKTQKDQEFSDNFMTKMSGVTAKLDSVNINASKAEFLDIEINEKINDMNIMVERDSVFHKTFYKNVVILLRDLRLAKQQLRETAGKDTDAGLLRSQKQQVEKDLEDAKTKILMLETQIHNLVKTN